MESPSPLSRYTPQNSKKRVFPGGSSSCMEPDVVEVSPPQRSRGTKPKSLKQKEVILPEIIDVDEDGDDIELIDEKIIQIGKGKEVVDSILADPGDRMLEGSVHDAQLPKTCSMGTANIVNVDDFSNSLCGDNNFVDMYDGDHAILLQSHFDSMDIPTGIEAPIPWLLGCTANKMKSSTSTHSNNPSSKSRLDNIGIPSDLDSSFSSWPSQSAQIMSTSGSSSTSGTPLSSFAQTGSGSLTWSLPEPAQSKSSLTAASGFTVSNSQFKGPLCFSPEEMLPNSSQFQSPPHLAKKPNSVGALSPITSQTDFSFGPSYIPTSSRRHTDGKLWSNVATSMTTWQGFLNTTGHAIPWVSQGFNGPTNSVHFPPKKAPFSPFFYGPPLAPSAAVTSEVSSVSSTFKVDDDNRDEVMKKFQLFKNFDTVQDFSDHYYYQQGSSVNQPSKNWTKKIQDEWRILEKDLPETIFVRVYETRMDLLRAVIIGAEGTPYHDGLFFFDVFFPGNYPNVPPKVHYHSGGLRINPNLYNCGKVCLSLLNTWSGSQKEKWIPSKSTMLQVLVSIQGLILNAKPYFNEPGYARMSGSDSGEKCSLQYNERTLLLSLKTMVYTIRRPPRWFEEFVAGHFCNRARDILLACQAYVEGAQVGCLVKGGVQDVDEGDKSCSPVFRYDVANFINTLVDAFKLVGAKDCEKFLPLAQKANGVRPAAHYPAYSFS